MLKVLAPPHLISEVKALMNKEGSSDDPILVVPFLWHFHESSRLIKVIRV